MNLIAGGADRYVQPGRLPLPGGQLTPCCLPPALRPALLHLTDICRRAASLIPRPHRSRPPPKYPSQPEPGWLGPARADSLIPVTG